jgi:hypothetical protein
MKKTLLSPDCKVIISRPYTLSYEWRIFMVNGIPVSASQYRRDGILKASSKVPQEVLLYAMNLPWTPKDVCVVDICETGGEYYVIEFNSMNSSGFYKCDIPHIICKISEHIQNSLS